MPPEFPPVDIPEAWFALLKAFERHGVQYVIAGSAADAIVERRPDTAARLVLAPAPYRRNLERVARVLAETELRVREGEGATHPLSAQRLVDHPALRWPLVAGGTELDLIGSAVGDGEFSIRVWRTRPIELTAAGRSLVAEVELLADHEPATA
jgi:hypothetical protein